jgi:hypothetical protein
VPCTVISEEIVRRSPESGRERLCLLCGGRLATDRLRRLVFVCDPCRKDRRDYNPACDPAFDRALQDLFVAHPLEVVYPRQALGISLEYKSDVAHAIRRLRGRLRIVGYPYTGGYVYVPDESGFTSDAAGAHPERP